MQAEAQPEIITNMQSNDNTFNLRPPSPPVQTQEEDLEATTMVQEQSRVQETPRVQERPRNQEQLIDREQAKIQAVIDDHMNLYRTNRGQLDPEHTSFSEQRNRQLQLRALEKERLRLAEQRRLINELEQQAREQQLVRLQNKAEQDRRIAAIDDKFTPGEFLYIEDEYSRKMIKNGYQAVQLTETANFVKQDIESFQWSDDKRIWVITAKMEELGYTGHSGFSFGWTMRQLQQIFRLGEVVYRRELLIEKIKKDYPV